MSKRFPLITIVRGKIRKFLFRWLNFKASHLYGSHLHPTVRLSRSTIVDKTNPKGVYIDEYTYLAGGAIVFAHDMCREMKRDTHIGKRCFIGANAVVMCGVTIGDEVIVGTGAIVTKDVPSNCIVAGNPAKIIREGIHTKNYGKIIRENAE